ncbi:hypothetical protein GF336_01595 [Candidatus Woesearchaeota archaeon]|nr:hypothetical protein [Candidatus Woesearchaeota archaeon]
MRRKIIKQGHNTLTVSLPKKWCEGHSLKDGEEIEVSEKSNCLVLSKESFKSKGDITVDISGLDRGIILLIESLYLFGYNLITIKTKTPKVKVVIHNIERSILPFLQDSVLNRIVGAEIISSTPGIYKIQVITDESREKFDMVSRRIFRIIIEMFETFIRGIRDKNRDIIESVGVQFNNAKRFSNYALRILNKFGHEEADKTTFYYTAISFLVKIANIIKNVAIYTIREGKLNQSKELCMLIQDIKESFDIYYNSFYSYDNSKFGKLHERRDIFKRDMYIKFKKLSKDDLFILTSIYPIYDILLDLSELRMAIEY